MTELYRCPCCEQPEGQRHKSGCADFNGKYPVTKPHKPECPVYRFAEALIGVDRRGICTCGAEQANARLDLNEASVEALCQELIDKGITFAKVRP